MYLNLINKKYNLFLLHCSKFQDFLKKKIKWNYNTNNIQEFKNLNKLKFKNLLKKNKIIYLI